VDPVDKELPGGWPLQLLPEECGASANSKANPHIVQASRDPEKRAATLRGKTSVG